MAVEYVAAPAVFTTGRTCNCSVLVCCSLSPWPTDKRCRNAIVPSFLVGSSVKHYDLLKVHQDRDVDPIVIYFEFSDVRIRTLNLTEHELATVGEAAQRTDHLRPQSVQTTWSKSACRSRSTLAIQCVSRNSAKWAECIIFEVSTHKPKTNLSGVTSPNELVYNNTIDTASLISRLLSELADYDLLETIGPLLGAQVTLRLGDDRFYTSIAACLVYSFRSKCILQATIVALDAILDRSPSLATVSGQWINSTLPVNIRNDLRLLIHYTTANVLTYMICCHVGTVTPNRHVCPGLSHSSRLC
ncbi:hypothetical protein J6590_015212 [Homalodisca vitripennis]|nr:hypothetical protein J6590_015212 [Homalodisca vitripennis]